MEDLANELSRFEPLSPEEAIANKVGGMMAAQVEGIENGTVQLFWYPWFKLGGQADFFLLFVIEHFVNPVFDVKFGARIYDLFHFLDQSIHIQPFS